MPATNAPSASDKPGLLGDESHTQRNQQHVDHEQFAGTLACHQMEPRPHQGAGRIPATGSIPAPPSPPARPKSTARWLELAAKAGSRISSGTTAISWNSKVPIAIWPCGCASSRRLGQQFADNGGRRHGQGCGRWQKPVEQAAGQPADMPAMISNKRHYHLGKPHAKHQMFHCFELGQRELQARWRTS